MTQHHVITGAGPVGSTIALQLAESGVPVRLLTRSGSGPEHPLIERRRVDVSKPSAELEGALQDAAALHHAIHGSAYDTKVWRAELPQAEQVVMDAAARAGVVVVFPESLYSYGPVDGPIHEGLPREATQGKLGVRTDLLRARAEHAADTVSIVASDFFGPRVRMAHAGERIITPILAGKTVSVVGSLDQPHSFTYVPDLTRAMITAVDRPDLWNSVIHAPTSPAVTQRELIAALAEAAGVPTPRMVAMPGWSVRALATVVPLMRGLTDTLYQVTDPFVMDSSAGERALGLTPTPWSDAVAETVAWWRSAQGASTDSSAAVAPRR